MTAQPRTNARASSASASHVGGAPAAVAFHVDRRTSTPDGRDVDDAAPTVSLGVGARQIPAGAAMGECTSVGDASRLVRDACSADPPRGVIASLACVNDPADDTIGAREPPATHCDFARRDGTHRLLSSDGKDIGAVASFFCTEWRNGFAIYRAPVGAFASLVYNDTGYRRHEKGDTRSDARRSTPTSRA